MLFTYCLCKKGLLCSDSLSIMSQQLRIEFMPSLKKTLRLTSKAWLTNKILWILAFIPTFSSLFQSGKNFISFYLVPESIVILLFLTILDIIITFITLYVVIMFVTILVLSLSKRYKEFYSKPVEYILDQDYLISKSNGMEVKMEWRLVQRVEEQKNFFIFTIPAAGASKRYIPKRALKDLDQLEDLRTFLQEKHLLSQNKA